MVKKHNSKKPPQKTASDTTFECPKTPKDEFSYYSWTQIPFPDTQRTADVDIHSKAAAKSNCIGKAE